MDYIINDPRKAEYKIKKLRKQAAKNENWYDAMIYKLRLHLQDNAVEVHEKKATMVVEGADLINMELEAQLGGDNASESDQIKLVMLRVFHKHLNR